jgi:hypothetical protein
MVGRIEEGKIEEKEDGVEEAVVRVRLWTDMVGRVGGGGLV